MNIPNYAISRNTCPRQHWIGPEPTSNTWPSITLLRSHCPCLAFLVWSSLLKAFGKPAESTMIPQQGGSRRPWYKRGGRLRGLFISSCLFSKVSVLTCVFVFLQVFLPLDVSFPRLVLVCIPSTTRFVTIAWCTALRPRFPITS